MKFSLIFFLFVFFSQLFPCTIVVKNPEKFNPDEYIFIGKITGHTSTIQKNELDTRIEYISYWGLEVELFEEIYLPDKTIRNFEIYPLTISESCHIITYGESYIKDLFPVGSKIRVVARLPKHLELSKSRMKIRLEASPYDNFNLSINIDNLPALISNKKTNYNYNSASLREPALLLKHLTDSLGIENAEQEMILSSSVYFLAEFEYRKDLFRLHSFTNDTVKAKIIHRLKDYRKISRASLINLVSTYIEDVSIRVRIFNYYFTINREVSFDKIIRPAK